MTDAYRELGWEYVCTLAGTFHIWRCGDPAAPELDTDPVVQSMGYGYLERKMRRHLLRLPAILLVWLGICVLPWFWGAGDMPLEAVPILLDGICWLPAQAVAAAFGRTAAISGDQLVLPAEEGSVVLTAGSLTGERDDRPFALSSLPFQWEGEFYLSLEDLCALLELTARREEGLISLIPRSAPSALLPEELPPIQPLPC